MAPGWFGKQKDVEDYAGTPTQLRPMLLEIESNWQRKQRHPRFPELLLLVCLTQTQGLTTASST